MINNRPKYLKNLRFYQQIPDEFRLDAELFPNLLSDDLFFLDKSCQPYTEELDKIYEKHSNYNSKVADFYNSQGITFQMVNVVANIYDFKFEDGLATGVPYALSIVSPGKRGK